MMTVSIELQRFARVGGQKQIQRLGRRDQDVRRLALKARALDCGVSPVRMAMVGATNGFAETLGDLSDAGERCAKVALDVDRERFERRHVQHAAAAGFRGCGENIRRSRHHRNAVERLAAAGRREDQRRLAACDRRPAERLRRGRLLEGGGEPGTYRRMKWRERISGRACHEVIL